MKHVQGGWPKEVDPTEKADVERYLKKMERDNTKGIAPAVQTCVNEANQCIMQNNINDLFEEYFAGEEPEHQAETISTKTVMLLKDPNTIKRSISKITWHPDMNTDVRVSVCYAILRFQSPQVLSHKMPINSYIWNLNNPNNPELTLTPPSPMCTSVFNHRD